MIVAITGKKYTGKSTVADYLSCHYGFEPYAFAEPMKAAVKAIFGWDEQHVNGDMKEVVDPRWGISPRQALQHLGTEWGQFALPNYYKSMKNIDRRLWAYRFAYQWKDHDRWVISDLRFRHELEVLEEIDDTTVIKIERKTGLPRDLHRSEALANIRHDYLIKNDGTQEDLFSEVDRIVSVLCADSKCSVAS